MQKELAMKTATIPSLRVAPELRDAAESLLLEGETLSGFVEQSLRDKIQQRLSQQAFVARGMASREEARKTNQYYSAESVIGDLKNLLNKAKAGN
jgi:predicted transcriptional regulator